MLADFLSSNLFWKVLGIIDFIAAVMIYMSSRFSFRGSSLLLIFMIIIFLKGAWAVWGSIRMGNYLNWMGYVDMASFLLLLMIFYGNPVAVPGFILAMIFFKAIYSLLIVLF
ncbi:MAG: hypothetical protein GQ477_01205 [Nanohaloarchaea archaeon]|nr:hypothetical protein [Candidatus Nanohaloarchaea archaeon]